MEKPKIKILRFEFSPEEARIVQRMLNEHQWPELVEDDLKTPDSLPNFDDQGDSDKT